MNKYRALAALAVVLLCSALLFAKDEKLTVDVVIQKHLASLGTKDAIQANAARDMTGAATAKPMLSGSGSVSGPVLLMAQAPDKFRLAMQFNAPNFKSEEYFVNGDKLSVTNVDTTRRSRLGEFLYQRGVVLKEGLFGGTLSSAWPLLELGSHKAKVSYDGLKKVDGRELHQLTYNPKKNPDNMVIRIFFEPETFRHVLTTYTWMTRADVTATSSVQDENVSMRDHHYELQERFSDFRQLNGLTLPVSYSFKYTDDFDLRNNITGAGKLASRAGATASRFDNPDMARNNNSIWLYEITFDQFNQQPIPGGPAAAPAK